MGNWKTVIATVTLPNTSFTDVLVWEGSDKIFNEELDWFSIAVFVAAQGKNSMAFPEIHVKLTHTDDFGKWEEEHTFEW